jgi:hypothetical protein
MPDDRVHRLEQTLELLANLVDQLAGHFVTSRARQIALVDVLKAKGLVSDSELSAAVSAIEEHVRDPMSPASLALELDPRYADLRDLRRRALDLEDRERGESSGELPS